MIRQPNAGSRLLAALAAIALGLAGTVGASAAVVLDQEQPIFLDEAERGSLVIGSVSEQKLAQTVEAGRTGLLVRIDLPVGCIGTGDLVLTITELTSAGLPGGRTLGVTRTPAASLLATSPLTFRTIHLRMPIRVDAGDRFAIVLDVAGAECRLLAGPDGDPYTRGQAFFDARPNPPGWVRFGSVSSTYDDLAFKTWVSVPSGHGSTGFCELPTGPPHLGGPGPVILPFPVWVPLCRCLEDPGLRSVRCGLFLPDLFLFREVPGPIEAGQEFEVRWVAIPLVDGAHTPVVLETLPQGLSGKGESKIDFGQDLKAFQPVERRIPLVAGEEVDLKGWMIEYVWPQR